jgi:NADH:ubiquinone oxidoreductase subunit 4 (subunit M)
VFYCDLGPRSATVEGWDLDAREHTSLWPMVALFLVMGVLPTFWLRAIDPAAASIASRTSAPARDNNMVGQVTAVSNTATAGGAR